MKKLSVNDFSGVADDLDFKALDGSIEGLWRLPAEIYHQSVGISQSGLWQIRKSPAHFKCYRQEERRPTAAMQLGSMIHSAILEPKDFDAIYCIEPKIDKRTKEGKAAHAAWLVDNVGKIGVDQETMTQVLELADVARTHPLVVPFIADSTNEVCAYWKDYETGAICRMRADGITELPNYGNVIFDIKTTEDASYKSFASSIANYGYYLQAAYYLAGLSQIMKEEVKAFVFIVIEKNPPYGIQLYTASQTMLDAGKSLMRSLLNRYVHCLATDEWPGYPTCIQEIDLPAWYSNELINV